jgi:hypothetical protein
MEVDQRTLFRWSRNWASKEAEQQLPPLSWPVPAKRANILSPSGSGNFDCPAPPNRAMPIIVT